MPGESAVVHKGLNRRLGWRRKHANPSTRQNSPLSYAHSVLPGHSASFLLADHFFLEEKKSL